MNTGDDRKTSQISTKWWLPRIKIVFCKKKTYTQKLQNQFFEFNKLFNIFLTLVA